MHTRSDQLVPLIWCATSDSSCDQLRQALLEQHRGQEALMAFRVWWIEQGVHSANKAIPILTNIARQQGVRGPLCDAISTWRRKCRIISLFIAGQVALLLVTSPTHNKTAAETNRMMEQRHGETSQTRSPAPLVLHETSIPLFGQRCPTSKTEGLNPTARYHWKGSRLFSNNTGEGENNKYAMLLT